MHIPGEQNVGLAVEGVPNEWSACILWLVKVLGRLECEVVCCEHVTKVPVLVEVGPVLCVSVRPACTREAFLLLLKHQVVQELRGEQCMGAHQRFMVSPYIQFNQFTAGYYISTLHIHTCNIWNIHHTACNAVLCNASSCKGRVGGWGGGGGWSQLPQPFQNAPLQDGALLQDVAAMMRKATQFLWGMAWVFHHDALSFVTMPWCVALIQGLLTVKHGICMHAATLLAYSGEALNCKRYNQEVINITCSHFRTHLFWFILLLGLDKGS